LSNLHRRLNISRKTHEVQDKDETWLKTAKLWERTCRGDARVYDGFYRENAPRLLGFLRQLLGDAQTAEDVTQETFLHLWRRPGGFHGFRFVSAQEGEAARNTLPNCRLSLLLFLCR
jgi:hypothetical protein